MDLQKLKEPFRASDIEWRVQKSGEKNGKPWAMVLAYVTNRAIMDRLDDVCGPENWRNEYKQAPEGGVLCGLSIRINDEWITKWDGSDNTNIEATKGGLSGSMKRSGVQWGIGRYLYNLEAGWAVVCDNGAHSDKVKETNRWFKWNPPQLPGWALPSDYGNKKEAPQQKPPAPTKQYTQQELVKKVHNGLEQMGVPPEKMEQEVEKLRREMSGDTLKMYEHLKELFGMGVKWCDDVDGLKKAVQ